MTYYLIIVPSLAFSCSSASTGTLIYNALKNHEATNQRPAGLGRVPMTFILIDTVADVKKLNIQENDVVLICLTKEMSGNVFDINNIERTADICSYLKTLPIKIHNLAVYV